MIDELKQRIADTTRDPEKRARILGISTKGKERRFRIDSIAKRLTKRWEKQRFAPDAQSANPQLRSRKKPFVRKPRSNDPRLKRLIAYDLETTRIAKGTPRPLYITAYGEDYNVSGPINSMEHLGDILRARFLIPETKGARFVAWNGNNFDVFFIAAALLQFDDYIIRPYLTRSKNLRGLRVTLKADAKTSWEFLDGMAMTVGVPVTLKAFLKVFAPDYQKLDGPDFEKETFNPKNREHVAYAERDSEGLYHAMMRAQSIVLEHFKTPLQPTIGNMGIKIFAAHIPDGIEIFEPNLHALEVLRSYVMRGGYCFCARKYSGPVWKYDINQAYAAAMREADLPAGRCIYTKRESQYAKTGIYRITAEHPTNKTPFYYRETETGKSVFGVGTIRETWLTSIEIKQLRAEGWNVKVFDGYYFDDSFRMSEYVNKLERLRIHGDGGPKGAQGTMIKAIGNNSYGKTVEKLEGIELVFSATKPDGFHDYPGNGEGEIFDHIWFRFAKPLSREYHQPQLGAFITAHVRMVLRRAILKAPENWLYADTDCVVFDKPVALDVDPGRYGLWKVEAEGKHYRIITKKVYADFGANEKHAKGLNVKRLTDADFVAWFEGRPPEQTMLHRQNFVKAMGGAEMYVTRNRVGQKLTKNSVAKNCAM